MVISSLENEKVKELAKLSKKKYRDLTNTYLVEGDHLVIEAYRAGVLKELILEENCDFDLDVKKTYVTRDVIRKITQVEAPTKIMGLCSKVNNNEIIGNKILLLDDLQDPGNLGTIIRSSVAFNVSTIILSNNTVDLYNPKVVRSTQGMMFHTNVITMDLVDAINELRNKGINIYATDVNNGFDVRSLSDSEKESFALIMGNEGNGVHEHIKEMADKNLYIEMNEDAESLNVAIATSILLYELGR